MHFISSSDKNELMQSENRLLHTINSMVVSPKTFVFSAFINGLCGTRVDW